MPDIPEFYDLHTQTLHEIWLLLIAYLSAQEAPDHEGKLLVITMILSLRDMNIHLIDVEILYQLQQPCIYI